MESSERIGFVGMGMMGSGMATNLVAAGHDVVVWNRTRAKAEAIVGADVAESVNDLGERCSVVMLCVSDTPDVEAIATGEGGLLPVLSEGDLVIDHSTISPAITVELGQAFVERGVSWVDAPVSGGPEGARRGKLSIMVGGDDTSVERALPFMETYGSSIIHVGPLGAGQTVKLVNQVLVVVNQLAVSEALLLASAGELDLATTVDAVKGGAAGSWMLANSGPQVIERDWRPGFTIDLQQKDLRLVLETADRLGVPVPGTALVFQLYRALQSRELGSEGNHALIKALEGMSSIRVGES